MIYIENI